MAYQSYKRDQRTVSQLEDVRLIRQTAYRLRVAILAERTPLLAIDRQRVVLFSGASLRRLLPLLPGNVSIELALLLLRVLLLLLHQEHCCLTIGPILILVESVLEDLPGTSMFSAR